MVSRVWLVVVAACALAQDKPASVRGTVVGMQGEPLRKTEVTLRSIGADPKAYVWTTDASGVFVFVALPPGKYVLSAQRNGFVQSASANRGSSMRAITVPAGQEVTGLEVKLLPQSVITGRIVDEDGDPLVGTVVSVLEERFFRGRRTLAPGASVMVNDLGEYRLAGLSPGKYYVSVEPRQQEVTPGTTRVRASGQEPKRNAVAMYFPGVMQASQAAPIVLAPGQEVRGMDMQIRRIATYRVRGRVVDEGDAPAPHTALVLLNGETPASAPVGHGPVAADGSFTIEGVPPGSHLLMANAMGREKGRLSGVMPVQVGSRDVENVLLRMTGAAQVSGVVRGVAEGQDVSQVRVMLDPVESLPYDMHSSRSMGPGNSFIVPDVTPGRYRADAFGAPDGYYVKSVLLNGQDVTETGFPVSVSTGGLEVVLSAGATTIEGLLKDPDGLPMAGGTVALIPPLAKRDQWRLFKTALADQNGRFALRNLTPGEYVLLGYGPGMDPMSVQSPEYLQRVESKGVVVKAGANARESVEVKVLD